MNTESDSAQAPFVASVWWDPKRRRIVLDPTTYVPGLLLAGDGEFSIVTPDGVAAEGSLTGATAVWPSLQKRLGAPVLDLQLADGTQHKIFFSRPHQNAPRLSNSGLEKIGRIVGDAGSAAHSAGMHLLHHASQFSDAAEFMHFAGIAVQVVAGFSEQKKGRDSLRTFVTLM
jgi:hypothetical protein